MNESAFINWSRLNQTGTRTLAIPIALLMGSSKCSDCHQILVLLGRSNEVLHTLNLGIAHLRAEHGVTIEPEDGTDG